MKNKEIIQKINNHTYYGLETIDVGSALYCNSLLLTGNKTDVRTSILRIIAYLLTIDIEICLKGKTKTAFLYSNSYKNRNDHFAIMSKLVENFPSYLFFHPGKKNIYLYNLRYLPNVFKWYKSFSKEFSHQESIYFTSMLLFGTANSDYIVTRLAKNNIEKIVVFSDMHLIDSLVVQKCNNTGIITITLQHGNFEVDYPFILSKSNYFITYGEYSKRIAIESGMDNNRILMAGMLRMIDKEYTENMKPVKEVKSLGVIFSGYADKEKDIVMYNTCKQYCENNNIDLYVKMHPHYGKEHYNEIDWMFPKGAYCDEMKIEEFKEKIDVSVVFSSTVFVEFIMSLFPVLLFEDGNGQYYKTIDWCRFHNTEELNDLILLLIKRPDTFEKNIKSTRLCFSEAKNILQRYIEIIQGIQDRNTKQTKLS